MTDSPLSPEKAEVPPVHSDCVGVVLDHLLHVLDTDPYWRTSNGYDQSVRRLIAAARRDLTATAPTVCPCGAVGIEPCVNDKGHPVPWVHQGRDVRSHPPGPRPLNLTQRAQLARAVREHDGWQQT